MAPTFIDRLQLHQNLPFAVLVLLVIDILIMFILGSAGWFSLFFSLALVGLVAVGLIALRITQPNGDVPLNIY
ncbi:hypothetical protein AAVH_24396 [Aphelenchoides avenae]|nr:hypothetical protein AAVH_24396 [Aphelenchus avenae]